MEAASFKALGTALADGFTHLGKAGRNATRGIVTDNQRSPLLAHLAAQSTDAGVDDLHLANEIARSLAGQGADIVKTNVQVAGAIIKPGVDDVRARASAALHALID